MADVESGKGDRLYVVAGESVLEVANRANTEWTITRHLRISGRVQGVSFRHYTREEARRSA